MDWMALVMALKAQKMNAAEFRAAVEAYLEENPEAVDQAAIEALFGDQLDGIEEDVGGLKSALNSMSTATASDEGKALMAKTVSGGKVTEWEFGEAGGVDPEDIAQAVDDWLNNHPEATTTVEDFSLTANKLVKGALGYVVPQQFGAKGDGETDDTQALKDCIDYAIANKYAVHLPMGIYVVMYGELEFTLTNGQSIVIVGDGQESIIKLKDDCLPAPKESGSWWCQIFTILVDDNITSHAKDVIFADFCIDGNRRNQSELINLEDADTTHKYESSQCISFRNSTATASGERYIDRVIVSNMRFYDPIADCVNVSGTNLYPISCIRDMFIENMVATDRHGTRNDIGFTGSPRHVVYITNCDCGSIHFEFNGTPSDADTIPFIINGCNFDEITLGGKADLQITNCNIGFFLINTFRKAFISSCVIKLSNTMYAIMSQDGECYIQDCLFTTSANSNANNAVYLLQIDEAKKVVISNCDFVYEGELTVDTDNDQVNDHAKGPVLFVTNNVKTPVLIDGCRFDDVFEYVIRNAGNNIILRNMTLGTQQIVNAYTFNISGTYMEFENIKATAACKNIINYGSLDANIDCNGIIEAKQSSLKQPNSYSYLQSWMSKNAGNFHRVTHISSPLDYTLMKSIIGIGTGNRGFMLFKGDTFIYDGPNPERYPSKWISKDTGETHYDSSNVVDVGVALEQRLITEGSGRGSTANRPTCFLSPGWQYYDTDLGKTIMWSGSAWVNLDGSALS